LPLSLSLFHFLSLEFQICWCGDDAAARTRHGSSHHGAAATATVSAAAAAAATLRHDAAAAPGASAHVGSFHPAFVAAAAHQR